MNSTKRATVAVASLAIIAGGFSGGAAQAASTPKVTTCSTWEAVGNSTVSARTCITVKDRGNKADVRGSIQLMNAGTDAAKVKATWTVSVKRGKSGKAVKVRTATVTRKVLPTGEPVKLTGQISRLDDAGLAIVRASIVVVAPKTGTDTLLDSASVRL
jgi:hypothetical protein